MDDKIRIRQPLDWDSDFFGLKIASIRVDKGDFDPEAIGRLLDMQEREGYALTYLFIEGEGAPARQLPLRQFHRLVDVKYLFSTDGPMERETDPSIEEFRGAPDTLFPLAYQAGAHSRYRLDPGFPPGEFERFYRTWTVNSMRGEVADHVLVSLRDDAPAGFVTLKLGPEASIGLIAVDEQHRGRGIGRRLVEACESLAARSGSQRLSVATQQQNTEACAFYRRCGMELTACTSIYHIWFNKIHTR